MYMRNKYMDTPSVPFSQEKHTTLHVIERGARARATTHARAREREREREMSKRSKMIKKYNNLPINKKRSGMDWECRILG